MADKKKKEWFIQNDEEKTITVVMEDVDLMPEKESKKMMFLCSMGYKPIMLDERPEEPKKRKNAFKIENAITFIKENESKAKAEEIITNLNKFKEKANKLSNEYKEINDKYKAKIEALDKLKKELDNKELTEEEAKKLELLIEEIEGLSISINAKKKEQLKEQQEALKKQRAYFKEIYSEEDYEYVVKMKGVNI